MLENIESLVLICLVVYICRQYFSMDKIYDYFEKILALVICIIPSGISLLVFDHSVLSKSDLLESLGMWFWIFICASYTAISLVVYSTSVSLIPQELNNLLKIESDLDKSNFWNATIAQMFIYSFISGIITLLIKGNYFSFLYVSLIVSFSINILLILSNIFVRIIKK